MIRKNISKILYGGVLAVSLGVFVKNTFDQGPDFIVYWKACRALLLQGGALYDLSRDGLMSFKYPPWTAPVFFPFALLPLGWAKVAWGLVQWSALWVALSWCHKSVKNNRDSQRLVVAWILFLPLWTVHSFNGQIALPMLAVALWLQQSPHLMKRRVVSAWLFSAKIFSLFPLLLFLNERKRQLGLWVLWTLSVCLVAAGWVRWLNGPGLWQGWFQTATSGAPPPGGSAAAGISVVGREAQGWMSLVFRMFESVLNPFDPGVLAVLWVLMAAVSWVFLSRVCRSMNERERWAVWLAWTPTLQPLAGFYSFVWVWPLSVLLLIQSKTRWQKAESLGAIACVTLLTSKSLAAPLGPFLERVSIKSWGVLFCVMALARFKKSRV